MNDVSYAGRLTGSHFGLSADIAERFELEGERPVDRFVPYVYLDGHRSGTVGNGNPYLAGMEFARRLVAVARTAGVQDVIFMVRTHRNAEDQTRVEQIDEAVRIGRRLDADRDTGVSVVRHGPGARAEQASDSDCTVHLLADYSEEWAITHPERIAAIPEVAAVVRFTKGHLGGGWIPGRMNRAAFLYCQTPSVSSSWSTEGLQLLLALMHRSARTLRPTIGARRYSDGEREMIRTVRDRDLTLRRTRASLNPHTTRVIAFSPLGPAIYEF